LIITDHFVFLHFPKAGGSFVSRMLKQVHAKKGWFGREKYCEELLCPNLKRRAGAGVLNVHGTFEQIPAGHRGKPVLSCRRNPFDRLVSTYEFRAWARPAPEELEKIKAVHPGFPDLSFGEYLAFANRFDIASRAHSDGLKTDIGFMTYTFLQFFCREAGAAITGLTEADLVSGAWKKDLAPVTFLSAENLNEDLHAALKSFGYADRDIDFIPGSPKVNVTPGRAARDWRSYYTDELYRLVEFKERALFDLFPGYRRSGPP
jgi:hypothetical protein